MARFVAKSAEVHSAAELDDGVRVGPFSVIGPHVRIGRNTQLENNVTVTGRTSIGRDNRIFPGAVIGADPQHQQCRGDNTRVVIGSHNVIRESVTINRATAQEAGITSVGSHCLLMACCHIAHDCRLGDRIVVANGALLGGHVHVDDDATLSANLAVQHFASIGAYSFVAGLSSVQHDVPPYVLVEGRPAAPQSINLVALRRDNFPSETIEALQSAFRLVYREQTGLDEAREILRSRQLLLPPVNHLLGFLQCQQEGRHGRGRETRRAA